MNRKQTVLIVALAAQVLLLVLLKAPFSGSAEASAVRAFLPELEGITATRLAIGDGQGGSVGLTNTGTGWTLDEADGYPADDTKVDSLLLVLRDLKIRRPVVTSSRYHNQLYPHNRKHFLLKILNQYQKNPLPLQMILRSSQLFKKLKE